MCRTLGEFPDALSVIRTGLFGQYGIRQVVIAGYPEGHGKISVPKLEQAMYDKLAALAFGIAALVNLAWPRNLVH